MRSLGAVDFPDVVARPYYADTYFNAGSTISARQNNVFRVVYYDPTAGLTVINVPGAQQGDLAAIAAITSFLAQHGRYALEVSPRGAALGRASAALNAYIQNQAEPTWRNVVLTFDALVRSLGVTPTGNTSMIIVSIGAALALIAGGYYFFRKNNRA